MKIGHNQYNYSLFITQNKKLTTYRCVEVRLILEWGHGDLAPS